MNKLYRWIGALMILCMGWSAQAQGVISSVTASSTTTAVVLGEGAQTSVIWQVNLSGAAPGTTLNSGQIVFRTLSGTAIGTQSRTLTRSVSGSGTITLSEAVHISSSVAYRAYRLGSQGIRIERSFSVSTDPSTLVSGSTSLGLSSAPGSGLLVARVDLRFDDGSRSRQVAQGSALVAVATLRTEGNGWLDARWEIADGPDQTSTPLYRPLQSFRQYVGAVQTITLDSPPLPTNRIGRHLLRLSIREPAGAAQPDPLQYQVMGASLVGPLDLTQPPDGALLSPDTLFTWERVPGAQAYLLELTRDPTESTGPDQTREGAAMLPADTTQLQLSTLVRQNLRPGQRYRWRVLALDEQGQVIAQSPPRRLLLP
jgi:hypothetical protein